MSKELVKAVLSNAERGATPESVFFRFYLGPDTPSVGDVMDALERRLNQLIDDEDAAWDITLASIRALSAFGPENTTERFFLPIVFPKHLQKYVPEVLEELRPPAATAGA